MTNYKKILFMIMMMLINITFCSAIYAQSSAGTEKTVKAAADAFYKKYLPQFGYPTAAELEKLRPFLSGSLYSSIKYEKERMNIWSAKNPGEKPPVIEDLFVCNHDEPPARFRTGKTTVTPPRDAVVTIIFDYAKKGKTPAKCQAKSVFIRGGGKWLLDNIIFEEDTDLRTLLSRKDYDVLPE